jgi:hypothetical protein
MSLFQFRSNAELLLDSSRQTGGQRKETSFHAVGDLDIYHLLLCPSLLHDEPPFEFIGNPTISGHIQMIR